MPRVGLQDHMVTLLFSFLRNLHTVSTVAAPIYILTNSVGGLPFLHTLSSISSMHLLHCGRKAGISGFKFIHSANSEAHAAFCSILWAFQVKDIRASLGHKDDMGGVILRSNKSQG